MCRAEFVYTAALLHTFFLTNLSLHTHSFPYHAHMALIQY
jgi:hypothetical protein